MGKILIATDVVPKKTNMELFQKGDTIGLLGEKLAAEFLNADYSILNLEAPFYSEENPIEKCGPNIAVPVSAFAAFRKLNIRFMGLANNHVMDQGREGLRTTIELLKQSGIAYAGAGFSQEEAAAPAFFVISGKKIGVYCCTEHEFSVWDKRTGAGANPLDLLESMEHIQKMKAQCDYAIVLFHGGKENYPYPSPWQQRVCRKMAEKGADLVVCQHSHCIGAIEEYAGGTIVYGQGNLLFDVDDKHPKGWFSALVLVLDVGDTIKVSYLTVKKNGSGAVLAEGEERKKILDELKERSRKMQEPGFLEREYEKFAGERINFYLLNIRASSCLMRFLNRLTHGKAINKKFRRKDLLRIKNYLSCEAHQELFTAGIDEILRSEKNGKK